MPRGGLGLHLGCPGEALGAIWAALGLILGTLGVILMVSGSIWEPPGAQGSKNISEVEKMRKKCMKNINFLCFCLIAAAHFCYYYYYY